MNGAAAKRQEKGKCTLRWVFVRQCHGNLTTFMPSAISFSYNLLLDRQIMQGVRKDQNFEMITRQSPPDPLTAPTLTFALSPNSESQIKRLHTAEKFRRSVNTLTPSSLEAYTSRIYRTVTWQASSLTQRLPSIMFLLPVVGS
jgi:hypothetical protein